MNRRFTRLTNAFSKKFTSHVHALGLYFAFYNFCRIHKTLRVTPAMAAGIADKLWTLADIVVLMDARAPKPGPRKPTISASLSHFDSASTQASGVSAGEAITFLRRSRPCRPCGSHDVARAPASAYPPTAASISLMRAPHSTVYSSFP